MHEEGRAKLLSAALQVVTHSGFEDASVDDICRVAGYSKGGFYFHFRGKEELLLQVVEEVVGGSRDNKTILGEGWGGLLMELWEQAGRKQLIRERLSEYYATRREALREIAGKMSNVAADPGITADLLLALENGLQIQHWVAPASVDRHRAEEVLGALLAPSVADSALVSR
jgi:AcrR family transcriptional regulator